MTVQQEQEMAAILSKALLDCGSIRRIQDLTLNDIEAMARTVVRQPSWAQEPPLGDLSKVSLAEIEGKINELHEELRIDRGIHVQAHLLAQLGAAMDHRRSLSPRVYAEDEDGEPAPRIPDKPPWEAPNIEADIARLEAAQKTQQAGPVL